MFTPDSNKKGCNYSSDIARRLLAHFASEDTGTANAVHKSRMQYQQLLKQDKTDKQLLESLLGIREGCHFVIPGGNKTLLLEGEEYNNQNLAEIAKVVMREEIAEQVGRVSFKDQGADADLLMPGRSASDQGEFCLNGVRALAANYYHRNPTPEPIFIRCAGNFVECVCEYIERDENVLRVEAKLHIQPTVEECHNDIRLVHMEGISHFMIPVADKDSLMQKGIDDLQKLEEQYAHSVQQSAAIGAIFYTPEHAGEMQINPIVHSIDYMKETGCASGSALLALNEHVRNTRLQQFHIVQPSGCTYKVSVSDDDYNSEDMSFDVRLSSKVHVIM